MRGGKARINAHFVAHLDRVLGRVELGHGMCTPPTPQSQRRDIDPTKIARQLAAYGRQIVATARSIVIPDARALVHARHLAVDRETVLEAPNGL